MPKDNHKHDWKNSGSSGCGLIYQCMKCTKSFTISKDSMDTDGIEKEINKMLARRDCIMSKDKDGPKPPPKPDKKVIPSPPKAPTIGDKARAGRLLSEHLRRIAQEETEFADCPDGDKMVTKAEALARLMFKLALGYEVVSDSGKTIIHNPSAGMIALIWDRIEGRSVPLTGNEDKKRTLPKKVSEESRRRLNILATGDSGSSNSNM